MHFCQNAIVKALQVVKHVWSGTVEACDNNACGWPPTARPPTAGRPAVRSRGQIHTMTEEKKGQDPVLIRPPSLRAVGVKYSRNYKSSEAKWKILVLSKFSLFKLYIFWLYRNHMHLDIPGGEPTHFNPVHACPWALSKNIARKKVIW